LSTTPRVERRSIRSAEDADDGDTNTFDGGSQLLDSVEPLVSFVLSVSARSG
jgi:hypothetical protein